MSIKTISTTFFHFHNKDGFRKIELLFFCLQFTFISLNKILIYFVTIAIQTLVKNL